MNRFDAAACGIVDLWTALNRAAHKLHNAKIRKQKRTFDVLRKPDNSECY